MQTLQFTSETPVGAIVALNPHTAQVFDKHGIDFCCGGKQSLAGACSENGIALQVLSKELLIASEQAVLSSQNYNGWKLPFLADYIVETHHSYLYENLDVLLRNTKKIADVHGDIHPELVEIANIYEQVATEMRLHLKKEEDEVFPAIKALTQGTANDQEIARLRVLFSDMDAEHEFVGDSLHKIRKLSNNFELPEGACATYQFTFSKLDELEKETHQHVHLENNVLFLKAANLLPGI